VLGTIVKPHGVRGTLLLHTDPSTYEALREGLEVSLLRGKEAPVSTTIERVVPHRAGAALDLAGVSDRDAAAALVGAELTTARTNLPATSTGEFYACDLLGSDVVSPTGIKLGRLSEIIPTGGNDVWVIRGDDGELLVPAVAHAVLEVHADERRIVVDPIVAVVSTRVKREP